MKTALMVSLLFAAFLARGQQQAPPATTMTADSFAAVMEKKNADFLGRPLPPFSLSVGRRKYTNRSFAGKVTFINFWFADCPPCMAEMKALNGLYQRFGTDANFAMVSLTFEPAKTVWLIKKRYHIRYPIYSTSREECYRLNNNNGFPTSVVIGRDGLVRYIHPGDDLDRVVIKKYFESKLYPIVRQALR